MSRVLMPKATAVWLIENTTLTFQQIADFCSLHPLEVQSIADGEIAFGMAGFDPISNGQLTKEEIDRCSADPTAALQLAEVNVPRPTPRTKGPRYTPVARRQDRPDGISWLLRNFPELSDGQISRLVGTTKPTINGIRERTHWNISNIKPRDPVALGLCSREDLSAAIDKARRAAERAEKRNAKKKGKLAAAANSPEATNSADEKPIMSEDDIPGVGPEPQPEAPETTTAEPTADTVFGSSPTDADNELGAVEPAPEPTETTTVEPTVDSVFGSSPTDSGGEMPTTEPASAEETAPRQDLPVSDS